MSTNDHTPPERQDLRTGDARAPADLTPYRFRYVSIPALSPDEAAQLEWRIRLHGIAEPLIILPDGQIIDGHHRHTLALKLGLAQVPVQVKTFSDPFAIEWYAIQAAVVGRQMSPAQRFLLAKPLAEAEAEHATLRRRAALKQFQGRVEALPPHVPVKGKTLERIRTKMGISRQVAERIKTVMDHGPAELFERLVRGDLRPGTAYRQTMATRQRPDAKPAPPASQKKTSPPARTPHLSTPTHLTPPPPRPRLPDITLTTFNEIVVKIHAWIKDSPQWTAQEQTEFWTSLGRLATRVRELIDLWTPYTHDLPQEYGKE